MALSVAIIGEGAPVVLLHGWGLHAPVWEGLAATLAHRFQAHMANLPGYGDSPLCAPYTLSVIARALAREMPPRCHVVGWSLGALVALAWAQYAPRQVARLALLAATPCFVQRHDWCHGVELDTLTAFTRDLESDCDGAIERFIALQVLGDDAARQAAQALRRTARARRPSLAALKGGLQMLLDTDLREALAGIKQRTLVVHGDRDRLTPLAAGWHLGSTLPGARFELIGGAAHAPFLSKPALVAALLSDFLDG
jgi:pimeloyl-[acyl-carrier protein] methyl ester esterase